MQVRGFPLDVQYVFLLTVVRRVGGWVLPTCRRSQFCTRFAMLPLRFSERRLSKVGPLAIHPKKKKH